jgi:uncharacterized protein YlzI (FlbEa/FlbD family)
LTRLNGTSFILNAELVEQIDSTPDTVITLLTGNNIVVREPVDDVLEKIAEGKIKKFYEETCLMNQIYVKDTSKTIDQLTKEMIAKIGENITIRRFVLFVLGDGLKEEVSTEVH